MASCPTVVIAGTGSGVGKTSLSLALAASLKRRGLRVQTFKVGPDFLDPSYLALASGRPCYNLDGWMTGEAYVHALFARAVAGADVAIVEGVMGLFDGADPVSSEGSTAEIARWLSAPVLLVVDAGGMSRSVAATVKGFTGFERGVRVAGVVANRCGSDRHAAWLAESLRGSSLPPLLGRISRGAFPALRSRHLGLAPADPGTLTPELLGAFSDVLERHVSLEAVMKLAHGVAKVRRVCASGNPPGRKRRVRIGVAWDEAFHFYYPDNLEALEAGGGELVRFSPIRDERLPEKLDGLYIGGGYPEEHAETLSRNRHMIEAVKRFAESGRPVYAECGGLMYLAEGIETRDGARHGFVGLLPSWTRMLNRPKRLGYAEINLSENTLLGPPGTILRGHEFHYSDLTGDPFADPAWRAVYRIRHRRSEAVIPEGYGRSRTLASYVHVHFGSHPRSVESFLSLCEQNHGE
ncbi:MAG: cobyrinate a,c-diamide synthase [Deltaproteobacteria bacterium]|nr:cobyrinate a,c-diamide synthase [Deltaproteobacteria bacterium]